MGEDNEELDLSYMNYIMYFLGNLTRVNNTELFFPFTCQECCYHRNYLHGYEKDKYNKTIYS
jgi:hypothetical protein